MGTARMYFTRLSKILLDGILWENATRKWQTPCGIWVLSLVTWGSGEKWIKVNWVVCATVTLAQQADHHPIDRSCINRSTINAYRQWNAWLRKEVSSQMKISWGLLNASCWRDFFQWWHVWNHPQVYRSLVKSQLKHFNAWSHGIRTSIGLFHQHGKLLSPYVGIVVCLKIFFATMLSPFCREIGFIRKSSYSVLSCNNGIYQSESVLFSSDNNGNSRAQYALVKSYIRWVGTSWVCVDWDIIEISTMQFASLSIK